MFRRQFIQLAALSGAGTAFAEARAAAATERIYGRSSPAITHD
jgi:hypothetical protein